MHDKLHYDPKRKLNVHNGTKKFYYTLALKHRMFNNNVNLMWNLHFEFLIL